MRLRFPLYGKVLFWFFANLTLVGILAAAFMGMQFRMGLDWLLAARARHQLEAMSEVIAGELRGQPRAVADEVLARYQAAHHLGFTAFRDDGIQVGGDPLQLPAEVSEKLLVGPAREDGRQGPPPDHPRPFDGPPPFDDRPPRDDRPDRSPAPDRAPFMVRSAAPVRYWVGIPLAFAHRGPPNPRLVTLLISSENITGGGLFFDPRPWFGFAAAAIVLSALVWFPIVGGITRAIRRVNIAARSIADGCFDVRVPELRRDELGELGASVNTMAMRLADLVDRQRRLTADVAHELCSPIARMQRALSIVEQRSTPEQTVYIQKLDGELQHMARLVEEVLSFSKAATLPALAAPEEISLGDLFTAIIARESAEADIIIRLPDHLRVRTIREALDRALANVLRNAVRYAGHAGPIIIAAESIGDGVEIRIRDGGPGIPAESLEKVFEPFYRPESARQRTTGGAGLGLAIVRRCIEACGGSVTAANAAPTGLQIRILLPHIGSPGPSPGTTAPTLAAT